MKQFTNVFERIDLIQEAEGFFVAREVGNYLFLRIPGAFEEADEAITVCQDWFVHTVEKSRPCQELAGEISEVYCPVADHARNWADLSRGVAQCITEARAQFREYLPYIVRML